MKKPLLSICVITYNHSKFISACLDSVLAQKVNFDVEILIGEDGSTDGTAELCDVYAAKYPDRMKVFHRSRNNVIYIDGKPTGRYNFFETIKEAGGKYYALIEGDDLWIDPLKLQKQVDFLEANSDYVISSCRVNRIDEKGDLIRVEPGPEKESFTIVELAQGNILNTATVVFKINDTSFFHSEMAFKVPAGDFTLHMHNAQSGKIHFMKEVMASYRVHGGSTWASKTNAAQLMDLSYTYFLLSGYLKKDEALEVSINAALLRLARLLLFEIESGVVNLNDLNYRKDESFQKLMDHFMAEAKGMERLGGIQANDRIGKTDKPDHKSGFFKRLFKR